MTDNATSLTSGAKMFHKLVVRAGSLNRNHAMGMDLNFVHA